MTLSARMPSPLPSPTLALDLVAAQRGDAQAFERIYRSEVGRVYALALRLTGDRGRADQLVQDAFIRAWRKLGTFRGESALSTWLHRLTVNVFLLDARGEQRRALRETDPLEETDAPPERRDASGDLGDRIDLERAIAVLPERTRAAFVLHDIQGYTHEEIGTMMAVTPSTVRVMVHRARRRLMEVLER
jgi:RNA polymerase sigma-70 factor (ECF subfamily)